MGKNRASTSRGWRTLSIALVTTLLACELPAVESITENFVANATVIKGAQGAGATVSYFSLSKLNPVECSGVVTSIGASSFADANATWTQNQFNGANGAYFVEFDSGTMVDVLLTDATTKTLTIPGSLPSDIAVGNTYRIRRHTTLSDIFGANNEAGLLPGPNSAQADNVLLHMPETQQTLTFFFSNVPGFTGWYRDNYSPANNVVVYPEQGLMLRRRAGPDVVLFQAGTSKEGVARVPVFPGFNLVGTLKGERGLTLSDLNLVTGDPSTGLAASSNPSTADNLLIVRPDSSTRTYFYSNFSGFEGWYDASYSPSGNVIIPAGSAFFINRKSPGTLFQWQIPAE
jgi:hypothetical protein